MPDYIRPRVGGASIFFTVTLAERGSDLLVREVGALREAVRETRAAHPFRIEAWVVMPDHLESQKVKVTHICNQCHNVHAPLKYINRAKEIVGMQEKS